MGIDVSPDLAKEDLQAFLAAATDAARAAGVVITNGAANRATLKIERKNAASQATQ